MISWMLMNLNELWNFTINWYKSEYNSIYLLIFIGCSDELLKNIECVDNTDKIYSESR